MALLLSGVPKWKPTFEVKEGESLDLAFVSTSPGVGSFINRDNAWLRFRKEFAPDFDISKLSYRQTTDYIWIKIPFSDNQGKITLHAIDEGDSLADYEASLDAFRFEFGFATDPSWVSQPGDPTNDTNLQQPLDFYDVEHGYNYSYGDITIVDPGQYSAIDFIAPTSVKEGESIDLTIKRTGFMEYAVDIYVSETDFSRTKESSHAKQNSDYESWNYGSQILSFTPGEEEKTVSIETIKDDLKESTEYLYPWIGTISDSNTNPYRTAILTSNRTIEIIDDFNETDEIDTTAPIFTSGSTAAAIDENSGAGQLVYTAEASDHSVISYSLKAGAGDAAAFSIDSTSGEVTLTADPDYETKSSYAFTVVATDAAGNSTEQGVSLKINRSSLPVDYGISIQTQKDVYIEGGDKVDYMINFYDVPSTIEQANAQLYWEVSGDGINDGDISSWVSKITRDSALVYQSLPDNKLAGMVTLNPDVNSQSLKISYGFKDDGLLEGEEILHASIYSSPEKTLRLASVSIKLRDIDYQPPSFTIDTTAPVFTSGSTAAAIDENSGAGQLVYTAEASDHSVISYSLKAGAGDAAAFSINPDSGAVTLTADPDYETKSSYAFTVIATDAAGNSAEQTVTLAINNLDETEEKDESNTWEGSFGNDSFYGGYENIADIVYGYGGNDELYGGGGSDKLYGGDDQDLISGDEGDDELYGESGDDTLIGGAGQDFIDGGPGRDRLDYGNGRLPGWLFDPYGSQGITVDLRPGSAIGYSAGIRPLFEDGLPSSSDPGFGDITPGIPGVGGGTLPNPNYGFADGAEIGFDSIIGIEDVITADGDDKIYGDDGDNAIDAGGGDDLIQGNGGNDQLVGGQGNDSLYGGPGNDEAIYSGSRETYSVAYDSERSTVTVSDSRQYHDGTDTITGVESFKFADITQTLEELISSASSQNTMDFTGDGEVDETDALLMMRHMMGTFPGDAITQGIPGITDVNGLRDKIMKTMEESSAFSGGRPLDIDGDGLINPFSDGMMILKHIHGKGIKTPGGLPEIPDFIKNPMRDMGQMQNHLEDLVGF